MAQFGSEIGFFRKSVSNSSSAGIAVPFIPLLLSVIEG